MKQCYLFDLTIFYNSVHYLILKLDIASSQYSYIFTLNDSFIPNMAINLMVPLRFFHYDVQFTPLISSTIISVYLRGGDYMLIYISSNLSHAWCILKQDFMEYIQVRVHLYLEILDVYKMYKRFKKYI